MRMTVLHIFYLICNTTGMSHLKIGIPWCTQKKREENCEELYKRAAYTSYLTLR